MSIIVQWDDDQRTILRWDFESAWNWDDFHAAHAELRDLSSKGDHVIDVIANMQDTTIIPGGAASQFGRIAHAGKGRTGVTVVVGANRFIDAMLSIFSKSQWEAGRRIFTANSLEEARAILMQRRGSGEEQDVLNG